MKLQCSRVFGRVSQSQLETINLGGKSPTPGRPFRAPAVTCAHISGGASRAEPATPAHRSDLTNQTASSNVGKLRNLSAALSGAARRRTQALHQGAPRGGTKRATATAQAESPEESCPPGSPLPSRQDPAAPASLHLGFPGPRSGRRGHPVVNSLLQNTTKASRSHAAVRTPAGREGRRGRAVVPRPPGSRVTSMATRCPHFRPPPPTEPRRGSKVALLRRPRPRVSKAAARRRFRFRLGRWLPARSASPPRRPAMGRGVEGRARGRGPARHQGSGGPGPSWEGRALWDRARSGGRPSLLSPHLSP